MYAFVIVAVNTDMLVGGKFSVQFPLPGHVGFAPSQPVSAFTKSEVTDNHPKQSSAEVNGIFSYLLAICCSLNII